MRARSVALLVCGVFCWGCQQATPRPPTAPSPSDSSPAPAPPAPPPPPSDPGRTLTLSGIIFETTPNGPRPIERGNLWYTVDGGPKGGFTPWSDAGGHYSIDVPAGTRVHVTAFSSDSSPFSQVCAATTIAAQGATLDVELVRPGQTVSNTRSPVLSGVIYRTAGGGRSSYANSFVEYRSPSFNRIAYTRTDADGRFEFCNLPLDRGVLTADDCNNASYGYAIPIDLRGDMVLDWDITSRVKSCPGDQ